MQWKITHYFQKQLDTLGKTYRFTERDFSEVCVAYPSLPKIELGRGIYKIRSKNTSIPVGKSGGYRIIIKQIGEILIPLLIYTKIQQENTTIEAIENALISVINEIQKPSKLKNHPKHLQS